MTSHPHPWRLSLPARALFEIPDIAGMSLRCTSGSLWLTLDGDPRDVILEPGETFAGTEHRRAIIYAFQDACLSLRPVAEASTATAPARLSFQQQALAA